MVNENLHKTQNKKKINIGNVLKIDALIYFMVIYQHK